MFASCRGSSKLIKILFVFSKERMMHPMMMGRPGMMMMPGGMHPPGMMHPMGAGKFVYYSRYTHYTVPY